MFDCPYLGRDLTKLPLCRMDLEGVVVKYKFGAYGEAWFKRVNPNYSQHHGRHEMFSRFAAVERIKSFGRRS